MGVFIQIDSVRRIHTRGDIEIRALDSTSVDIDKGRFVAFMGPSGSGKTTLLNIVAGIDRPTSGTVTIDGVEITSLSESKITDWRLHNIGYVFQFYNLLPVLTAYENVEMALLPLPLSKKARHDHVLAALEAVGVLDRKEHYPRQLSGGQEQRVAIARALVTDPPILVADEPTGNLDAESEQEIMVLLKRLNEEFGKTLIMVTHDAMAAAFAHQVLKLEKGRLAVPEGQSADAR